MYKKILITGPDGFLGSFLSNKISVDKDLSFIGRRIEERDNYHYFEIGRDTNYANTFAGIDCVIHCAARVHVMKDSTSDPLNQYRDVNTYGALNLAKQAAQSGVKRFIFVSSIKVNGENTNSVDPITSFSPRNPLDSYGRSKSEAELALIQLSKDTGLELVIIRPTLIYGPGVGANFASLMRLVDSSMPLPFKCINNNKRSLVSVTNLVDLIAVCIDHPKAPNQTFLVSDGNDVSTYEMVDQMAKALGKPQWQLPVPKWCYKIVGKLIGKQDVVDRLLGSLQVDITHTIETLNWVPRQSLEEGFSETAQAFLQSKKK